MKKNKSVILGRLNPADRFTLAMDEEIRKEDMPGSLCGFALELTQTPDINELTHRITEFTQRFPVALASLQQRGRRFYWCRREESPQVFFQHICPENEDKETFHQYTIEQVMSHQESREGIAPLEFHLLTSYNKNIFFIRWIHPFCDARGADLILKYLCTEDEHKRTLFDTPETKPLVTILLNKFSLWKKISLFFKAKRYIEQIDQMQSIVHVQHQKAPNHLQYEIRRFSEEQTAMINRQARYHVGLTGTSLYYIGCLMRALNKIQPDSEGDAYCVPYAFNLRKQKALSPVLGNHVCALFAQAPKNIVKDRERLFKHLKHQNANVIRQQLDYAFLPLMWAGSWLSLERYGKALRQSYKTGTERSSFWFSDIGQPDFSGYTLPGTQIDGLFHLCQMTSPPALALLSCQYQNRLTFTYNFTEPLITTEWLDALHEIVLLELLGNS